MLPYSIVAFGTDLNILELRFSQQLRRLYPSYRSYWRKCSLNRIDLSRSPSLFQRAGLKGVSYTFFTTENAKSARELVGILREAKAVVPPQLEEMTMYGGGGGRSKMNYALLFA